MENEIIRLKRRLYELEELMPAFDIQFEKYTIEKTLNEIVRFGKIMHTGNGLNIDFLKTAITSLKMFIAQVERMDEYKQELEDSEKDV